MIKRIEKKYKSIEEENEFSSYLEHFEAANSKDHQKKENSQQKSEKENYFCNICEVNFEKSDENLNNHLKSKVIYIIMLFLKQYF